MSRVSRIRHPPGRRYFKIHLWAVTILGRDTAAVLSALEFRDQFLDVPGTFCVTRAKLIADLEGLVSRNKVDAGIAALIDLDWIASRKLQILGDRNLQTVLELALRPDVINAHLAADRLPQTGKPGKPGQGAPETPNEPLFGVSSNEVNNELLKTTTRGTGKDCSGGGVDELEELLEALEWELKQAGKGIRSRGAWAAKIMGSKTNGLTCADQATLADYRAWGNQTTQIAEGKAAQAKLFEQSSAETTNQLAIAIPEGNALVAAWNEFQVSLSAKSFKGTPATYDEAPKRMRGAFAGFLAARGSRPVTAVFPSEWKSGSSSEMLGVGDLLCDVPR